MLHDLPHPGLLPEEKENRSPPHSKTCDWICRTAIGKAEDGQRLFLLLGEKERLRASVTTIFHSWFRSSSTECRKETHQFSLRLGVLAPLRSPRPQKRC